MFSRTGASAITKDLSNTIALCGLLNHPEEKFKSVHIAGTNGKGSTSHMLAAILQTAGYKTGLYTSPHLVHLRERIQVNGLMINEIRFSRFKKGVQTLLYLPHFLSWVIIRGIVLQVFAPDRGLMNILLKSLGMEQVNFLTEGWNWVAVYVGVGIWQSAGWGTILFLAAMAGINPELYEAAEVDGANRFQRILKITLPSILPVIIILLILQVGRITAISFDRPFIIGNTLVADYAQVISTYVYDVGLKSMRHNMATAIGLFQSAIGLVFLLTTNWIAEKNGQEGIYK